MECFEESIWKLKYTFAKKNKKYLTIPKIILSKNLPTLNFQVGANRFQNLLLLLESLSSKKLSHNKSDINKTNHGIAELIINDLKKLINHPIPINTTIKMTF